MHLTTVPVSVGMIKLMHFPVQKAKLILYSWPYFPQVSSLPHPPAKPWLYQLHLLRLFIWGHAVISGQAWGCSAASLLLRTGATVNISTLEVRTWEPGRQFEEVRRSRGCACDIYPVVNDSMCYEGCG